MRPPDVPGVLYAENIERLGCGHVPYTLWGSEYSPVKPAPSHKMLRIASVVSVTEDA